MRTQTYRKNYDYYDRLEYYSDNYEKEPDYREELTPLINHLQVYDKNRLLLENNGGELADLQHLTDLVNYKFPLKTKYNSIEISLSDANSIKDINRHYEFHNFHVDIRLAPSRMPVYYLCRIKRDYFSDYSFIIEDFYSSPGYAIPDERFLKLMWQGRERYFLRLSQFRDKISELNIDMKNTSIDDILFKIGYHILQAAWHEDQRLGILTAKHLDLPLFHQAIELLYLCLSGELCELRSVINDPILAFFKSAYPQPAIQQFLVKLKLMDGHAINSLPNNALKLYSKLLISYNQFLQTQLNWRKNAVTVPLFKIILANINRYEIIKDQLKSSRLIRAESVKLEKISEKIINEIIS